VSLANNLDDEPSKYRSSHPHKLTNKGNKMQSVLIKTMHIETGNVHEFAYECHSEGMLLAIIKGTLSGCAPQGWAMTGMEIAE
jgi:hypothetical protein